MRCRNKERKARIYARMPYCMREALCDSCADNYIASGFTMTPMD